MKKFIPGLLSLKSNSDTITQGVKRSIETLFRPPTFLGIKKVKYYEGGGGGEVESYL